ncbi:CCA-adding enzyme [compost metagenome]
MNRWKQLDPLMQRQGEEVLQRLLVCGHQAYFVGGCVRDELMGRSVHDMDIATSAMPEEVISIFSRTVPTGLQHGTVTVLMENYSFEVTTFRRESNYEDHRRPSSVEFVKAIAHDLQRRDFTMNAIACDLEGELTDPYGGQQDIVDGIIRCVGKAEERFDEDALRMMRAVRFASVFAFRPVKSLWSALLRDRDKLSYIAMERIRAELERIILGPNPLRGLELLRRSRLLDFAKAPIPNYTETQNGYLDAIERVSSDSSELRWSLLLQGLGSSGEETLSLMRSWTFPASVLQATADIIMFDEFISQLNTAFSLDRDSEQLRKGWIQLELRFGPAASVNWLSRQRILESVMDQAEMYRLYEQARKWHDGMVVYRLTDLAVSGGEIMGCLGRKGGPWLGELMKNILLDVALGDLPNEKGPILEHAKVVVNKQNES